MKEFIHIGLLLVQIAAAVVAGGIVYATFSVAEGAPQEAAGAALALAVVVIPYTVTATLQRMMRRRD